MQHAYDRKYIFEAFSSVQVQIHEQCSIHQDMHKKGTENGIGCIVI